MSVIIKDHQVVVDVVTNPDSIKSINNTINFNKELIREADLVIVAQKKFKSLAGKLFKKVNSAPKQLGVRQSGVESATGRGDYEALKKSANKEIATLSRMLGK